MWLFTCFVKIASKNLGWYNIFNKDLCDSLIFILIVIDVSTVLEMMPDKMAEKLVTSNIASARNQ